MSGRFQWLIGVFLLVLLAVVGVYAYNLGLAHGLAESARLAAPGAAGAPVVWWPRPWGFGFFPFFPIFPLFFFVLFWIVLFRAVGRRGRWNGPGCGFCRSSADLDEWHRRAHSQQEPPQPAGQQA